MIRLVVGHGNGYHCGCCRRTRTSTEEFYSMADVRKRITEIQFEKKENEEDMWIESVSIVRDIEVKPDMEYYESMKKAKTEQKSKEAAKEAERERKEKEALFAQLQKELGK